MGPPNLSRETTFSGGKRGQEKCNFLSFSLLQMMSWQPHPVDLSHTLLKALTIHTYV